jgi:hypothetical protein
MAPRLTIPSNDVNNSVPVSRFPRAHHLQNHLFHRTRLSPSFSSSPRQSYRFNVPKRARAALSSLCCTRDKNFVDALPVYCARQSHARARVCVCVCRCTMKKMFRLCRLWRKISRGTPLRIFAAKQKKKPQCLPAGTLSKTPFMHAVRQFLRHLGGAPTLSDCTVRHS